MIEYEDGTVAYCKTGEFTQAFRVSIAGVQSFSVVKSGKMFERTLNRLRASRAVLSWPSELRRPLQELAPLEAALVALDVPRARLDVPEDREGGVAAAMRRHGAEVARNHAVDAAIAASPELPADELLEALEEQGLLSPADDE